MNNAAAMKNHLTRSITRLLGVVVAAAAVLATAVGPAAAAPTEELFGNLAQVDARIMFETVVPHESGGCLYQGRARVRTQLDERRIGARMQVAALGPCGEAMRQRTSDGQAVLVEARTDGRGRPDLVATAGEVVMSGGSTMLVAFIAFGSETSVLYVPGPEATITFGTFGTEASVLYDFPDRPGADGWVTFGAETSVLYEPGPEGFVSFGHETTV